MDVKFSSPREDNSTGGKLIIVVDGFNAPLRCGLLVRKGRGEGSQCVARIEQGMHVP